METIIDYLFRTLFFFTFALTIGTVLLLVFVRICLMLGLWTEEGDGGGMREFFKNFS